MAGRDSAEAVVCRSCSQLALAAADPASAAAVVPVGAFAGDQDFRTVDAEDLALEETEVGSRDRAVVDR